MAGWVVIPPFFCLRDIVMLVFIDESGKPHPKDSTENPVLCAVCINERDIKNYPRIYLSLK